MSRYTDDADGRIISKWELRVSHGDPCGHCDEIIDLGYTAFRPRKERHLDGKPCKHWICLRCTGWAVRRWQMLHNSMLITDDQEK